MNRPPKPDQFWWMNNNYGITARKGQRVRVNGKAGTIVSGDQYIWVRFDGDPNSKPCHPTEGVEYDV